MDSEKSLVMREVVKIKLIFQEIKRYQEVSKMSINTDVSGV